MSTDEREFVLSHVFKDVSSMKENVYHYSPIKEYFGVPWKISSKRSVGHLELHLYCEQEKRDKEWSIDTRFEFKLSTMRGKPSSNGKPFSNDAIFESKDEINARGWYKFTKWEDLMKAHVIDDTLRVEVRVKINRMTGVNLRNFGEFNKHLSDVVLVVDNQKFYVSKLFLASQCTCFKTLFLKTYPTEPTLYLTISNMTPDNFQKFLEILYGDAFIDETTVDAMLLLSYRFDAQNPRRQCEEFLIEKSEKSLKEKFDLATKYGLLSLKTHCLASMESPADVASVLPSDLGQLDRSLLETLLQKSLSFI